MERVAADPEMKERVLRMQRDVRESGGPTRAADEIDAYLKRHGL